MKVSVIIPTYNEKENIEVLIPKINEVLKNHEHEVIVVDDNSPDGTANAVLKLRELYKNIKLLKRPRKLGLSSAILDGVKIAKGTYIVVMDADLQHPPEILPRLIEEIEKGYDIVIASRYVKGGGTEGWSFLRKIISLGAMAIAKILIPKCRGLSDIMSGFFIIKREIIINSLNELNPKGFKILLEILARSKYGNVAEIPYVFKSRYKGKSKLGFKEIFNYLIHVINLSPYVTLIKFASVGAIGTVINLSVLALMEFVIGIEHLLSSAIAIEISVINNFILNDIWTFRKFKKGPMLLRMLKFHFSSATGLLTQYVISQALYYLLHIHPIISQFTGILLGFIVNYILSKEIVWKH